MTRLKTQTLRLLPLLVAIMVASTIIFSIWIAPAQTSSSKEIIEFGSIVGPIFLDGNTPQTKSYEWDYNLHIVGNYDETLVLPRLPFKVVAKAGSNSGFGYIELDLKVYINNELGYRAVIRNTIEQGEPSGNTSRTSPGTPGEIEQVDQKGLKDGKNSIRIVADLQIVVDIEGSQDFQTTLGRPFIEIYKADSDRDGVVDVNQLTSVHTGLVAIPAAALVGGIGWWGSARLIRRWTSGGW